MIFLSLLLVLVSLGLLIFGLTGASQSLIWSSVGSSLLAGCCLIFSVVYNARLRRAEEESLSELAADDGHHSSSRNAEQGSPGDSQETPTTLFQGAHQQRRVSSDEGELGRSAGFSGGALISDATSAMPPVPAEVGSETGAAAYAPPPATALDDREQFNERSEAGDAVHDVDHEYYEDLPDEPAEEIVSQTDAAAIVDFDEEVHVVDGRPRYHLDVCRHLNGREAIPLYLDEAREAGFTPCSLCRPDSVFAGRQRARTLS